MSEPTDPEQETKRDRRRFWWVSGGIIAVLLGFIAYVVLLYDIAPPEDAWLLPAPFPPASGPHSIPELVAKAQAPLEASYTERAKLSEDVRRVKADHVTEARAYLEKYHAPLEDLNAFLAANQGPLTFPGGDQGLNFSADCSYLSMFQYGANLAAMQACLLAREGKVREAVDQSLALIRLGKQLSQQGCFLIHWLVAVTVQTIAKSALEEVANNHFLSNDEMKRIETVLADTEITSHDFKSTLQGEYLAFKRELADLQKDPAGSFKAMDIPAWAGRTVKTNLTLASVLELQHPVVTACDLGWCQTFAASQQLFAKLDDEAQEHPIRRYLSANIGGNFLIRLTLSSFDGVCERGVRMTAFHRQMRIMLALRRFELEHGTLPGRLEELCPKYLPAVPLDPYNDKPMRWNATTKALYSVGKDFVDDGGSIAHPPGSASRDKDVGMLYWWKDTPKK